MRLAWSELTRREVGLAVERGAVCAIGVGSLEQHGDHLPTDTDTFMASSVLNEAADRCTSTVITLPPIPYGFSPYHMRFGGTVSLSAATFSALIRDICSSVRAAGAGLLLVINGHGGNEGLLRAVSQEETGADFSVVPVSYWNAAIQDGRRIFTVDGGFVGHAGQAETSLALALRSDLVGRTPREFESITEPPLLPTRSRLGSSGVIGDPGAGSAELGHKFFEIVVGALAAFFDQSALKGSTVHSQ
jgi:creatinine amidohydrolase